MAAPMTRRRAAWAAAASAACMVAGWSAVGTYRAGLDAERALEKGRQASGAALARAAERRMAAAVEALSRPAADPVERLGAYRRQLEAAERAWVASLSGRPADARGWVRLAAVSWELDADGGLRAGRLAERALALAPHRADVRRAVADLALDMGRTADGLAHWRDAIAIEPAFATEAIASLSRRGFAPDEIAAIVPATPRHLVALARTYFAEGRERDYIALVEPALAEMPDVALLASWANAHRRAGEWSRLARGLDDPALVGAAPLAVQVRLERARTLAQLGRVREALDAAGEALALDPQSAVAAELVGVSALAAGDPARAVEGFSTALAQVARNGGSPETRARLYRGIGRAEEARFRVDRARDAYRRADELEFGASHRIR
jgi:tetratricopeptide (TPR) repeat protein